MPGRAPVRRCEATLAILLMLLVAGPLGLLSEAWAAAFSPVAVALLREAAIRWTILLAHSAVVVSVAAGGALIIGVPAALLLARSNLPGRRGALAALIAVAGVPVPALAVGLFSLVPPERVSGSPVVCGLLSAAVYAPLAVSVLTIALLRGEPEPERAALLEASAARVLWHITLPALRPAMLAVAVLVALLAGTQITLTDRLLVRTFAEEVYTQYQLRLTAAGPVLAGFPALIALALVLIAGWAFVRDPARRWIESPATLRPAGLVRLPRVLRWLACGAYVAVLTALIGLVRAGVQAGGGWLMVWRSLCAVTPEIARSAGCSGATSLAVVVASLGIGWLLVRGPRAVSVLAVVLVVLLLATPGPVVGIELIQRFNRPGLPGRIYDSPVIVVIALTLRTLGPAALIASAALWQVPEALDELACIDGADLCGRLRHIVWPLTRPAAGVIATVSFLLAFGEVSASMLVVPPGFSTAAVRIFTLLHYGIYRDVVVLGAGCAGVAFGVGLVLARQVLGDERAAHGRA